MARKTAVALLLLILGRQAHYNRTKRPNNPSKFRNEQDISCFTHHFSEKNRTFAAAKQLIR